MAFLQSEGLIAPDEIPSEHDAVPLDFTGLNNREIGSVHSRYAVRHAHAIFILAQRESRLGILKRNLRLEQAKFRISRSGRYKTKYALDDAMERNKRLRKLQDDIAQVESERIVLDAVAQGYDDLRAAASREMFRRSSEHAPKD